MKSLDQIISELIVSVVGLTWLRIWRRVAAIIDAIGHEIGTRLITQLWSVQIPETLIEICASSSHLVTVHIWNCGVRIRTFSAYTKPSLQACHLRRITPTWNSNRVYIQIDGLWIINSVQFFTKSFVLSLIVSLQENLPKITFYIENSTNYIFKIIVFSCQKINELTW